MKKLISAIFIGLSILSSNVFGNGIAKHLQEISVTIKSGSSQGSGVIITRELKTSKTNDAPVKANFVWTAAHVVDNLRSVRTVVDPKTGTEKKVVEFRPAFIVKELIENGRKVGEVQMECKVIKYSDSETGHDLALLYVLKKDFISSSAEFYLDNDMNVDVGTQLFHVGSLLGQVGANSFTSGILSQVGRVINLAGGNSAIFDQTSVTAMPGSSGGGVFLAEGDHKGQYIGMLVRGSDTTFNLIVPIRRMHKFCEENNMSWALNSKVNQPSLDEVLTAPIEEVVKLPNAAKSDAPKPNDSELQFLIKRISE